MAYLSPRDLEFLEDLPLNLKKPPLRKLIDLMCKDCSYDIAEPGTWRQQVAECACTTCPLYKARPMPVASRKGDKTDD